MSPRGRAARSLEARAALGLGRSRALGGLLGLGGALVACAGAPVDGAPEPTRPICAARFDEARHTAHDLAVEGRLRAAERMLEQAERACSPLAGVAREERLSLLRELGAREPARALADLVLASPDASPRARALAEAARREPPLEPLEARARADLGPGDERFAGGDLPGAVAAYADAVAQQPFDPWALAAWGAALSRAGKRGEARKAFERAIVASGADERLVVLAPRTRRLVHRAGVLLPDGTETGLLSRAPSRGPALPDSLVGQRVTVSATHLVAFGDQGVVLAGRDGRGARTLDAAGLEDAQLSPDGALLVTASMAKAAVYHLGARRWGAARDLRAAGPGHEPASPGRAIRFAGPSRVAVGRAMLSLPDLDEVFRLAEGARVYPTAVVELDVRPRPSGEQTFVVVRRLDDGKVVFEPELTEGQDEVLTAAHPTLPVVAWIDGKKSGIADLRAGTITRFHYDWVRMTWPSDMRFSHDGREVCVLDTEWRPSRQTRGKLDLCFVDDAGAVTLPATKGMRPGSGLGAAALSPDRALGAYVEVSATSAPAKQTVRVVDLATKRELRRITLEVDDHQAADVRFVGPSLLEVHAAPEPDTYDARTGARVEAPPRVARRLVDDDAVWPDRGVELALRSGVLALEEGPVIKACVSGKLELLPIAPRCGGKTPEVSTLGLDLDPPPAIRRGFSSEGERGERLLLVESPPAVRLYDASTGKLVVTAAAAGPTGLALLPSAPTARVELVVLGADEGAPLDENFDEHFPQARCVARTVVLPLEACAPRVRAVARPTP